MSAALPFGKPLHCTRCHGVAFAVHMSGGECAECRRCERCGDSPSLLDLFEVQGTDEVFCRACLHDPTFTEPPEQAQLICRGKKL